MRFDPQKSLFDLPIVRHTIITAAILSTIVACIIIAHNEENFLFTGDGFNNLIAIYRVPLGILAVGLTLVGIFGANHRSEQTKRQIERSFDQINLSNAQMKLTENQNIFSNFYKHIEEFSKYCEDHGSNQRYLAPRYLYSQIFDKSFLGDYSISEKFLSDFSKFIEEVLVEAENLKTHIAFSDSLELITVKKTKFAQKLKLVDSNKNQSGTSFHYAGKPYILPGGNAQTTIEVLVYIIESVDTALRFEPKYVSSREVEAIKGMNTGFISPASLSTQINPFDLQKIAGLSK